MRSGRYRKHKKQRFYASRQKRLQKTARQRLSRILHQRRYGSFPKQGQKKARRATRKKFRLNFRLIDKRERAGTTSIQLPETLSLLAAPDDTIAFFSRLRYIILDSEIATITLKHSSLRTVTPEAALILIAEMMLANAYAPRCGLFVEHNDLETIDPHVRSLLNQVGYWDYFALPRDLRDKLAEDPADILHHEHNNRGDTRYIMRMMEHFEPDKRFGPIAREALFCAISECLANVFEHAYSKDRHSGKFLFDHWWASGYRERTKREVSFCIYDQGVGIPGTIRTRFSDMLAILRSDEQIIVDAVIEGRYSRTGEETRGQGLPSLKDIFSECEGATVYVFSHKSICKFEKAGEEIVASTRRLDSELPGTLVVWKLNTIQG